MTGGARPWWRPRLDGLAVRVAAFLTLALLPLGLIALYQTREYQEEARRRAELTLLALTEQGAAGVGSVVESALGAAQALSIVADLLDDPESCSRYLRRFVGADNPFDFVGLMPAEGPVTCSSVDEPFDLGESDWADLADLMADPRIAVRPSDSRRDALVIAAPLTTEAGGQPGYLALSIPHGRIDPATFDSSALRPLRLITFNAHGRVLTGASAAEGEPSLDDLLPQRRDLAGEASGGPRLFEARDGLGQPRVYTVAPLVPGVAYAMGIWAPEQAGRGGAGPSGSPLLFPILMWLTSLVVAFWAIHRLVIRRVATLAARMRRFGLDRSLPTDPPRPGAPHELREIETAFRQMAQSILQDEARMEDAFRERGVLLREIHHRVKNNLQLISSIVSMQVRRIPEPRTRAILRRLQDRVLTLAAIYRSLYTSPDLTQVNAALVLRAIVEQDLRAAPDRIEATLDIEDLVLDPDRIVPLAFLAAEAVSNALARAGAAEGRPSLSVTLHRDGGHATLRVVNSLSGSPPPEAPGQGLGQHLIQAFAAQVGGPVEIDIRDGLYILSIAFPVTTAPAEAVSA